MMQENTKFVSQVPASVLDEVQNVAELHGVSEVWLFGSAANPDNLEKPNDWDIAMLGVKPYRLLELANCLKKHYPNSKVDLGDGYKISLKNNAQNSYPPFHFVLGTPEMQKLNHPIFSSIHSGSCFYRAD